MSNKLIGVNKKGVGVKQDQLTVEYSHTLYLLAPRYLNKTKQKSIP